ncbi:MAG TPA: hypothetical protein VFI27_00300 [candidate division Zixibacteria bacterium]|nr:hypothetical protein [candidate division Zixibacteria bacterium]
MSESNKDLRGDLEILEAMASEMDQYLQSQALFWPMMNGGLPRLTIGGYLMRQHRLTSLRDQLDANDKVRLEAAVGQFNEALVEKIVRFEERAHQEIHARLRQWGEYLKELHDSKLGIGDYYISHVQTRLMITSLIHKLEEQPYELDSRVFEQLAVYDNILRNYWVPGSFIWADEWKPAYPEAEYWWLYGQPRSDR